MTTQLKAGTSNAPEVIVFDFDTSTITSNSVNVGDVTTLNSNGLCTTVDCYNCNDVKCNQNQCNQVHCDQVHCNQVQCNQVQCNQVKCSEPDCDCNCSYDSYDNCDRDCKD